MRDRSASLAAVGRKISRVPAASGSIIKVIIGIGCDRNASLQTLQEALTQALQLLIFSHPSVSFMLTQQQEVMIGWILNEKLITS
ncbi:MAG: cobalamin biosynthesis protein [Methylococcales bacterium]